MEGKVKIVSAYTAAVSPCIDCRYCFSHSSCSIRDEMDEIYPVIEGCDRIVIISPIYFSELTGPLLSLLSRLQRYYAARTLRGEAPIPKEKLGAVLLVGGGDGKADRAVSTAKILLHQMNVSSILPPLIYQNTNQISVKNSPEILEKVKRLATEMKKWPV